MIFQNLFNFSMKLLLANRIALDGTPCSAASHLGLFCICPIKGTTGLNESKINAVAYFIESVFYFILFL